MGDATVHANLMRPKSYEVQLHLHAACRRRSRCRRRRARRRPSSTSSSSCARTRPTTPCSAIRRAPTGAPTLALFGGDITPNLHALAKRFSNLDNFYSLAEQSLQGHEWTTANMANDYVEKGWLTTWGRATRPLGAFSASDQLEHLGMPATRTAWEHLDKAGVAYHNYGEIVEHGGRHDLHDVGYPGVFFNTGIPDVDKMQYVIDNLNDKTLPLEPFIVYVAAERSHGGHVAGQADAAVDGRRQRRSDRAVHGRAVALAVLGVVGGVLHRGRSVGRRRPRRDASFAMPGDVAVDQARLHVERALRRAGDVAHDHDAARHRPDQPARRQRARDVRRLLGEGRCSRRTRSCRARSR